MPNKNKPTEAELLAALKSNNSKKLQKAVGYIDDYRLVQYGTALLEALQTRYDNLDGTSETQYFDIFEIAMTLGFLDFKQAKPLLETIAKASNGIAGIGAGCAYIRMARKDKSDFSQVFDFLNFHEEMMSKQKWGCSTDHAGLFAANFDRMVPDMENQEKLIAYGVDYFSKYLLGQEGYSTRCVALFASVCAGLNRDLSHDILHRIMEIGEERKDYTKTVAEKALRGSYSHYYPID